MAVMGLGIFYTFVSWMMIAGNGERQAIEKANADPLGLWIDLAEAKLGGAFIGDIYLFLIVIGSFACGLAFHNAASRYLYAIGRELPATKNTLGRTHGSHHTPHVASMVQSVITLGLHAGLLLPGHRRQRLQHRRPTPTSTDCWRSSARWRS
jgi:amino acid transporter